MGQFLSNMRGTEPRREAIRRQFEDYVFNRSNSAATTPPVEEEVLQDTSMGRWREIEAQEAAAAQQAQEMPVVDTPEMDVRGYVSGMREKMIDMDKRAATDFVQSMLGKGLTSFQIVQEGAKYNISADSIIRELQKPQYAPAPAPVDIAPVPVIHDATVARFRRASAGGDRYGPTLDSVTKPRADDYSFGIPDGESKRFPRLNRPLSFSRPAAPVMAARPAMLPVARPAPAPVAMPAPAADYTTMPNVVSPLRAQALSASVPPPAMPSGLTDITLSLDRPPPAPMYGAPDKFINRRTIGRGPGIMR